MSTVRSGPVWGLYGQFVLLAVAAGTVGLGPVGWLVGVGYGLGTCALLARGLDAAGSARLGPANRVTLTRATLVGVVAAFTADGLAPTGAAGAAGLAHPAGRVPALVAITVVALLLDALDGVVARRTGTATALGARFDMEVDALLILVLSVAAVGTVGGWVLAIGAMRYAYVAAAWPLPWLRGTLPPRYWRKVVAATQGIVLVVAVAGRLPRPVLLAAVVGALALLVESFGRDVGWLWRHRSVRSAPVTAGRDRRDGIAAPPEPARATR